MRCGRDIGVWIAESLALHGSLFTIHVSLARSLSHWVTRKKELENSTCEILDHFSFFGGTDQTVCVSEVGFIERDHGGDVYPSVSASWDL